jgi:acyl carrier protein
MDSEQNRLQEVFRRVFDMDELTLSREMSAKDVPDWDSLAHIQLIVAIEKEFKVKFKTAEIVELKNVGQMIDLIGSKLRP